MIRIKDILPGPLSQLNSRKSSKKIKSTVQITQLHKFTGLPKVSLTEWRDRQFVYNGTLDDLVAQTTTLTVTDKQILTLLIRFTCRGLPSFMGQIYIAKAIGRNHTYVNECISKMRKMGLIDVFNRGQRGKNCSNVYRVAQQFFDRSNWDALQFIPAVKSMLLSLLLLCPIMRALPAHIPSLRYNPKLLYSKELYLITNVSKDTGIRRGKSMKHTYTTQKGVDAVQSDGDRSYWELKSKQAQLQRLQSTNKHCGAVEEQRRKVAAEEAAGKSWKPMTQQELWKMFKC